MRLIPAVGSTASHHCAVDAETLRKEVLQLSQLLR
jgi:hypothetical protein